ncbi:MAG TPA: OmpA family protein [Allosphingosinicella sp.]|jgi:outer membrane protein OmpA-like peptidoglycan-associated protein
MRRSACLPALAAAFIAFAAPAAALARSPFVLFFETGGTAIDTYGNAVLDNAAAASLQLDARELLVIAHADRVGSEADNLRLSHRRAEAVRAALVRRGVPIERIRIQAHGESRPMVQTADGVAELQNRTAWVIMQRMCNPPPGDPRAGNC